MAYDLVIKNGRVVDGSGMPGFGGDVAIKGDRIVALGRVEGPARRTIDADGLVVAPGIIDHHTHMDAQIFWDPFASASSCHGVTSVIMGNCGLALAPCRPQDHEAALESFIGVEAIPRRSLEAGVPWGWETFDEYLRCLQGRIGVNVGCLIGHNAVRQYVMGDAASERKATAAEIRAMQAEVRTELRAGALGFSINQRREQRRGDGSPLPGHYADDNEIYAEISELARFSVGVIQINAAGDILPTQLAYFGDLSLASRRPVNWQILRARPKEPGHGRRMLAAAEEQARRGARLVGSSNTLVAAGQANPHERDQTDLEAVAELLRSPFGIIGQSDAGAHSNGAGLGYGYATRLLGDWVRDRQAMPLEQAVRSLTFVVANLYDISDRGLLRPGYKADLALFDPATVSAAPPEWVDDLPGGEGRNIQRATGVEMTIVNGEPLIERGQPTGEYPGQIIRNRLGARTRRRAHVAA